MNQLSEFMEAAYKLIAALPKPAQQQAAKHAIDHVINVATAAFYPDLCKALIEKEDGSLVVVPMNVPPERGGDC